MTGSSASTPGSFGSRDETSHLRADDVRVAAQSTYDALLPVSEADWSVQAGTLEWACRATLDHVLTALDKYSRWLATPSPEPTPPDQFRDPNLSIAQLLAMLRLRAGVLAAVVRASDPTARGFPIMGRPDAEG